MSPLAFMQRVAAPVPRMRLDLIRFGVPWTSLREVRGPALREHGGLVPNAMLRPLVASQGREVQARATEAAAAGECAIEEGQVRPPPTPRPRL